MSTHAYQVQGLTCGHCVAAVTDEITSLAPEAQVTITLGDPSAMVITGASLTDEQVAGALDEAGGYVLVAAG